MRWVDWHVARGLSLDLKITGAYDNGSDYESISTQVWMRDIFACKVT